MQVNIEKKIAATNAILKTLLPWALYSVGAHTDCTIYHNARHIAAEKIHGVVWFCRPVQPSLTCYCR